ncbi:XRE family transcriptional regulator [Corticibacter populi]|uniref:XRE family transcriptional regulator n=1 Tax=Corticibacter populi TaxID=1550736 RepID=A0A3M6QZ18_9BURK|nr:helix-turn-helix transcriptional regulator [Corticibacter populi]RMX08257.1 XRE family transcriptional regulator [Corticibacter populi]RZS35532.1 transcriptional regulator with XRE-family HTH domain [Corticibacter populi]
MNSKIDEPSTLAGDLRSLGGKLAKLRLSRNLTQAHVAREAGASISSIKRLEAGENTSLETLLRVLGVLGLKNRLLECLPDPDVRPVERVRHGGRERRRAREKNPTTPKATDWAWGEEDET